MSRLREPTSILKDRTLMRKQQTANLSLRVPSQTRRKHPTRRSECKRFDQSTWARQIEGRVPHGIAARLRHDAMPANTGSTVPRGRTTDIPVRRNGTPSTLGLSTSRALLPHLQRWHSVLLARCLVWFLFKGLGEHLSATDNRQVDRGRAQIDRQLGARLRPEREVSVAGEDHQANLLPWGMIWSSGCRSKVIS